MKIVALDVRHVRIKLRRPIRHASYERTHSDNVIVSCTLSDGTIGFGEGVPRDYVTGETVDSAIALLKSTDWTQFSNCRNFADAVHLAERFRLAPVPGDERECGGNAARCAVELAMLDAYGRAYGEPMMNVVKLLTPDIYQPFEYVRYSGIILSGRIWKCRLAATAYWLTGFRDIKVKVGVVGHNDPARLKIIRAWAGKSMDIRVDANEAWTPSEAIDRIRALEPAGITSVEQPVPHEQVADLAEVRKITAMPIMLDESVCSMIDAERAVRGKWCDLLNLRISKCGGFIPTLRLAEMAARHNIGYQLGCQVGESGILSAAGRQFAASVTKIRHREGSYDRHLVEASLTRQDMTFRRGGRAPMLPGSGLSVSVDVDQLASVTERREVLLGST